MNDGESHSRNNFRSSSTSAFLGARHLCFGFFRILFPPAVAFIRASRVNGSTVPSVQDLQQRASEERIDLLRGWN